jgi:hypothetical protein
MIRRKRYSMPTVPRLNPRVISAIEKAIKSRWPKNYSSVAPYIKHLDDGSVDPFDLLNGAVQSGKFLTINILMWVLMVKGYRVIYVTKRLDIVRKDVLSKINKGLIRDVIQQCCGDEGLGANETKRYQISTVGGLEMSESAARNQQTVPVFLMENVNYLRLLKHLNTQCNGVKTLVILDEVHELYSDTSFDILDGGLEPGLSVTNRHFLHKLYDMCRNVPTLSMLGVTATPERVLVKDPFCCVNNIFYLEPDAPVKGFKYYGYERSGLKNIDVEPMESTYTETVQAILDRPTQMLKSGSAEIKLVFICTSTFACDQAEILDEIKDSFGNQVHCKMLISDDTRRDNAIPKDYVVSSLSEFFDSKYLTDEICQNGALVLIARKTLAASATVKPVIGKTCEHIIDDVEYQCVGITDQLSHKASSIEDHMQKSRLFGWYPAGHKSTYWVPSSYINDMQYGVNQTHWGIIDNYNCQDRLESIRVVKSSMDEVTKVCAGKCPYRKTTSTVSLQVTSKIPKFGKSVVDPGSDVDTGSDSDAESCILDLSDGPVWIKRDNVYHIYTEARRLEHHQLDYFADWSANDTHNKVLRDMDTHSTTPVIRQARFYDLFGAFCKKHLRVLQGDTYYSSWQAGMYKELSEELQTEGKAIADMDIPDKDKQQQTENLLNDFAQRKLKEDSDSEEEEEVKVEVKRVKIKRRTIKPCKVRIKIKRRVRQA